MSTPNPTPSEKHIWVAASIHTCSQREDERLLEIIAGSEHRLSQAIV